MLSASFRRGCATAVRPGIVTKCVPTYDRPAMSLPRFEIEPDIRRAATFHRLLAARLNGA